ncbi:siroheme synthase [Aestuariispira insulae]|uniref:precorrin-2 dehydrogenase n=1 Tax=Aestuariispira insulae TaxID=1461337 RepID=A0A3D9HJE2_9PROT|nr:NAD(P)-dependent oxidoreductase [Aestuariispira insulae]RED49642.1 uroporphyrinogen-III C-methyltransferase /precorrin-2 dehydrogenase [Aestuariispira insulae]
MNHFPIFMALKDRLVLVVGGEELAARKIRLLHKAEAAICVVAPELCTELKEQVAIGKISWREQSFDNIALEGASLVFAATDHEEIDTRVAQAARDQGIPVNAVDRPAVSDFIMPAIVDRAPIVVAISSGGSAPVLARKVRAQIEAILPARLGELAVFADRFRSAVKAMFKTETEKRRFWEAFFKSPIAANVLDGNAGSATEHMLQAVNDPAFGQSQNGKVTFVGAGSGDPDLLTLKAVRALQDVDLIIYDREEDAGLLETARRDAERLYVGSDKLHQTLINRVMADAAKRGRKVVRLVGGDSLSRNRSVLEKSALEDRQVMVDIIPGIQTETQINKTMAAPAKQASA